MFGVRCFISYWNFNYKPATLADGALHEHPSAVRLDDMFHEAQTDSNTLRLALQLGTAPVKPLENLFVFLRRNARTVVADEQVYGWWLRVEGGRVTSILHFNPHHHRFALRRMFDGIINQVHQCLLKGPAVYFQLDVPAFAPLRRGKRCFLL